MQKILFFIGRNARIKDRTAIKEPLDLMYMFWAVTTGITVGASMYILAVAAFLIMLLLILCFRREQLGAHHRDIDGVADVALLEFNGEYHG